MVINISKNQNIDSSNYIIFFHATFMDIHPDSIRTDSR
jgi:hypothetical protein